MPSPYTDLDRPPLPGPALRRALIRPGGLWSRLDLRAETGSTNADTLAAARAGAPEGLVTVAERQSAGRGRLGRHWASPARAGLAVSVLLRPGTPVPERSWPATPMARYGWLPLLAGLALARAVCDRSGVDAVLKWPNDLLVRPATAGSTGPAAAAAVTDAAVTDAARTDAARTDAAATDRPYGKCAGILAEVTHTADGPAVVIGIGLNVSLRADELPDTGDGVAATSLWLAGAATVDRSPLLRAVLRGLADWYGRWRDEGGDAEASGVRPAYLDVCGTLGGIVRVLLPGGGELVGEALAVDDDGRLVIRAADGSGERSVAAGDIRHLR